MRQSMNREFAAIVVESPLQLLCGVEASLRFGGEADFYIRISSRAGSDGQLRAAAQFCGISPVELHVPVGNILRTPLHGVVGTVQLLTKPYSMYFFGSYFSGYLSAVDRFTRNKPVYFLDDGMATLLAAQKLASDSRKRRFFTFLDIPRVNGNVVENHAFEQLRERFPCPSSRGAYFMGQPLVERGFMTRDAYLCSVKDFAANLASHDRYYVPHRSEDVQLASEAAAYAGLDLLPLDVPVELYFLRERFRPKVVGGISSTALLSLKRLFPDVDAHVVRSSHQHSSSHARETMRYLESVLGAARPGLEIGAL